MFYRMLNVVTSARYETRRVRKQINVLQALDVAKTQLYHFTTIVIAGMGFFTDAYDLFSISLITDLLGRIYYSDGKLPTDAALALNCIAFVGTVIGQIFFGWLGDRMGRKYIYGVTLKLMVLCSLASGLSFSHKPKDVIATLCFFRFWLGIGIGGDYPLSATIMSEYANKKTRGTFIAAVFAMQGLGNLAAGAVVLIISAKFKNTPAYKADEFGQADYVWRIVLMFGAVPALLTYYWRMKMPETARYTALIAKNLKQAASDMTSVLDIEIPIEKEEMDAIGRQDEFGLFSMEFFHRHGRELLGTTMCWLVLDIVFYSLNLFMKDIFNGIGWFDDGTNMDPLEQTYKIARTQAIITLSGTLPGYFFTVAFIDKLGRIRIQLVGFTMMTIFILGLAGPYNYWHDNKKAHIGFAIMYASIFFFANFGPNSTTFILPTEIFPTRLRSTCHGISGAVGKIGAIIGVVWFVLYGQGRTQKSLLMLAGCNLIGVMFTLALPESKGMSLEDITGEIDEVQEVPIGSPGIDDGAEFIHSVVF
ncbi:hypothetical protein HU200_045530 [Digitaria exilis]|uniref:H(+)/Pi cotransporter n=1 Tax=Digitaria exilis TaxID=1010633 RepID=A0A835B2N2_9POAL|nr:hypothetical protein HU200_045530 [Digitaria exilis]